MSVVAVCEWQHKIGPDVPMQEVIDAALAEPEAHIAQVVHVPAGSTLIFFESVLHASGIISSDKDRVLVIAGYTPSFMQTHMGCDPDPALLHQLATQGEDDEEARRQHALLSGSDKYGWQANRGGPDARYGPRHAMLSGEMRPPPMQDAITVEEAELMASDAWR
eukprot:SAG11_NODE_8967_length_958_cov_1.123399_1_plen_163_part_10